MAKNENPVGKFRDLPKPVEAMLDRLVEDPRKINTHDKNNMDLSIIGSVFKRTSRDTSDLRNIFKTLPWLHLPREILVSSITAPGDMVQVTLNISSNMKNITPSLAGKLDKVLKDFFLDEMGLESKVYDWVDKAWIAQGAYPIMIIPEASLDRLIKGGDKTSFESIENYGDEFVSNWFRPKGILAVPNLDGKDRPFLSMESMAKVYEFNNLEAHTIRHHYKAKNNEQKTIRLPIHITDNPIALRKPFVDELRKLSVKENAYGATAFEAVVRKQKKTLSDDEIKKHFFKKPKMTKPERLEIIPVTKAEENLELGHPLKYELPMDAVVPIFVPGDPSKHTHYIVIQDGNGYPVSYMRQTDFYTDIRQSILNNGNSGEAGEVLNMAKDVLKGSGKDWSNEEIDRMVNLTSNIVEMDVISRIRNGLGGGELEFSMPEEIKRLMLARTLSNRRTTLVLVPADYMIYIAYEYNEFGVGVSMLEDGKALAAQTAAVHVANVIGAMETAIPGKDINIELDADDGTPDETAQFLAREALNLQHRQFPYNFGSVASLTEQVQLSGYNVNVTGNSRYPETKVSVTASESANRPIDKEFMDGLKEDLFKLFGVTPEMVGNVNQPEFATTAVNNSLLLLKRVMVGQSKTNPFLTDFVRTYTYNSGILLKRLMDVLEEDENDLPEDYENDIEFLEAYLSSVNCHLPKPQTENLMKQAELLEKVGEAMEKFLDAHFKKEYLAGMNDPVVENSFDVLRESLKGMLLRKWMRDHGVFRDLDIFTTADDGSVLANLNDEMVSYTSVLKGLLNGYQRTVAKTLLRQKKEAEAAEAARNKLMNPEEPEEAGGQEGDDDFGLDTPPSVDDDESDDFDNADLDAPPADDGDVNEAEPEAEAEPEGDGEEEGDDDDNFGLDAPPKV